MTNEPEIRPLPTHPLFSEDQIIDILNLKSHINSQLNDEENIGKKKICVMLHCEVPDDNVLFALVTIYEKQGWGKVRISPAIRIFYKKYACWPIYFIKQI